MEHNPPFEHDEKEYTFTVDLMIPYVRKSCISVFEVKKKGLQLSNASSSSLKNILPKDFCRNIRIDIVSIIQFETHTHAIYFQIHMTSLNVPFQIVKGHS